MDKNKIAGELVDIARVLVGGCEKLPAGGMRENCEKKSKGGKSDKKDDSKDSKGGKGKMPAEVLEKFKKKAALVGHHHKEGSKWYVDSNFINVVQHVYPGAILEHMGFGEFYLTTPDGKMDFDRMRGKKFEGQVGRSHEIYDDANDKVVKKAIKLMERSGKSEEV